MKIEQKTYCANAGIQGHHKTCWRENWYDRTSQNWTYYWSQRAIWAVDQTIGQFRLKQSFENLGRFSIPSNTWHWDSGLTHHIVSSRQASGLKRVVSSHNWSEKVVTGNHFQSRIIAMGEMLRLKPCTCLRYKRQTGIFTVNTLETHFSYAQYIYHYPLSHI